MTNTVDINEKYWRESFSLFYCEQDEDITNFIRNKAIEFEKRDKSRTYIYYNEREVIENGFLRIVGYFSLALKTIKIPIIESMSNNLRKRLGNISDRDKNVVAYLIGQIGRDSTYNSDILDGNSMLKDCYNLIASVREIIGGRLILIECKPEEKLCKFYEDRGYINITEKENGLKQYIRFMD